MAKISSAGGTLEISILAFSITTFASVFVIYPLSGNQPKHHRLYLEI